MSGIAARPWLDEPYVEPGLSDVLDSEEGGVPFEELFRAAVMSPEDAEARAIRLAQEIRARAEEARAGSKTLGAVESLATDQARQVANHQLPYWTERMVVSFLNRDPASGTRAVDRGGRFELRWPDGLEQTDVTFDRQDVDGKIGTVLTVEDRRVRQLLARLPSQQPGGAFPVVTVEGVSDRVSGWWSLWRVSLQSEDEREQRLLCLFVDDAGKVLGPTAKSVWDAVIDGKVRCASMVVEGSVDNMDALRRVAAERGESIFRELSSKQQDRPAVSRGCRAVWTSIIGWGVLAEGARRGRYTRLPSRLTVSREVGTVLADALAISGNLTRQSSPDTELPALFPFCRTERSQHALTSGASVVVTSSPPRRSLPRP